jgi:hypothetical protein
VHISLISFYACLKHGCFMLCSLQIPFRFWYSHTAENTLWG